MNITARVAAVTLVAAAVAITVPATAHASIRTTCLANAAECGSEVPAYLRAIHKPAGPSCQFVGPFMTYRVAPCKA